MSDKLYSIKELCEKLNEPRQKVRRRVIKLGIKAHNEDDRTYKNEPLKYTYQDLVKLASEFNIEIKNEAVQHRTTNRTDNVQHRTTEENTKDKLISVLEEQLKEANESKKNLEKLLDQQQHLNMISSKEINKLKLELKEKEDTVENDSKKKKWWEFWK